MTKQFIVLFTAIVLGLGWAMRGLFGHEWGASWAGAMGAMAVLIISNRKDWIRRAPVLAALGALGWGVGGMMSYGIVIGYCKSTLFVNSLYGYTMLAVIGSLYGFIGGGLFGLGLESSEKKKPKWATLLTEMFVGGALVWGLIIYQMEWYMTPPRSELWAGCLGAAIALAWFLHRNDFKRALRVAGYSALGGGFGFAFGNFIQVLGTAAGIQYNWWNVMEFILGFCGGLGMAYAVLTREWPESVKPSKIGNWIAVMFVFILIPIANYFNGLYMDHFVSIAEKLNISDVEQYASMQFLYSGASILIFAFLTIIMWHRYYSNDDKLVKYILPAMLFITTIHYNFFAYIKFGTFYRSFTFGHSESLYIFIVILIYIIWYFGIRKELDFPGKNTPPETWKRWGVILVSLLLLFVLFAFISINSHSGLPGAHNRF